METSEPSSEAKLTLGLSEFRDARQEHAFLESRREEDVQIAVLLTCCIAGHFALISLLDLANTLFDWSHYLGSFSAGPSWIRILGIGVSFAAIFFMMRARRYVVYRNILLITVSFAMTMEIASQWMRPPEYVGTTYVVILLSYFAPLPLRYILTVTIPTSIAMLHLVLWHKTPVVQQDTVNAVVSIIGLNILGYLFALKIHRLVRQHYLREASLLETRSEAERALAEVRVLSGLLPICACCKKIRDDDDTWHRMESYISSRSDARFTHGMCPECSERYLNEAE